MAYTSSKPGRTRLLNAFGVNQGKVVLLDMPGYGHASREEWGVQVMKYLTTRRQCVLSPARGGHGMGLNVEIGSGERSF